MSKFSDAIRLTWAGAAGKQADKKGAAPAKKEEKKVEAKKEEDVDDLFGDDTEEDEVNLILNTQTYGLNIYYRLLRKLYKLPRIKLRQSQLLLPNL